MFNGCLLHDSSKQQGCIAQSSAESELLAIVRATSEALGMVSLAADFGVELQTRIHVDASAALGILERRGVGRVRHLDVGALLLQEQHLRRIVEFVKGITTWSPDTLTRTTRMAVMAAGCSRPHTGVGQVSNDCDRTVAPVSSESPASLLLKNMHR